VHIHVHILHICLNVCDLYWKTLTYTTPRLVLWPTWMKGVALRILEGNYEEEHMMWVAPCGILPHGPLLQGYYLSIPHITHASNTAHAANHTPWDLGVHCLIAVHSTEQIQMVYPCSSVDPGTTLSLSGIHLTGLSDRRANLQRLDLML